MNRRPPFTASPLGVWAVEDTAVQLAWGQLPAGPLTVTATAANGASAAETYYEHPGGPGALTIGGLSAGTPYQLEVKHPSGRVSLNADTTEPPPGPLLSKVATVSDLHLGASRWGFMKTMTEATMPGAPRFRDPHPLRNARAAITEAIAWGAEVIVIKGDAAHHRHPDNFAMLGDLVDEFPDMPMLLVPGNHDVDYIQSRVDLPASVGARGLRYTTGVDHYDLDGLRIVAMNTSTAGLGSGTLSENGQAAITTAANGDKPALLALHHHFHRYPMLTHWPPGIDYDEASMFFRSLHNSAPNTLVTSGHSHRNRARWHNGIPVTEVASTRDWPGVWAGYSVHAGGIRQVVRRIESPDSICWHEYSRGAVLGAWGLWAPGPLGQRCVAYQWTEAGAELQIPRHARAKRSMPSRS